MSWDLLAKKIPHSWQTNDDMPDGWNPSPIGMRSEIIADIKRLAPDADFTDPTLGHIDGPDYSIEVGLPGDEPKAMISFFVRGGDEAAFIVADIVTGLGLRAFDTESAKGIIFPGADVADGLRT